MTQQDLFQNATSYPVAIPASHLVRPGSDEARKMTAISGRKYLPLCKRSGRLGAFSKMFLDTSVWASTKCYLTWKAKVTPSNHLLFQLAPSMPRTDETGSGLWPTATTQDNPQVRGQGKTIGTNRGTTLGGAVRMWSTPTAAIAQGTTRPPTKGGGSRDLRQDVKMWPTPRASKWKGTGPLGSKSHNHRLEKGYLDATVQERNQVSGSLNPQWVEWLMGYPEGWTDLKG